MGCATGIAKYLVFFANLVFALAGLALVVVGILYKLNISEVTTMLPGQFGLAPILSIIIGAIVFTTAFLGCCGAVKESSCMLTTYAIILLTIFIIQVAIGVYAFIQIKDTNQFRATIRQSVEKNFNNARQNNNQEAKESMRVTQSWLHCCGVNGPDDYQNSIFGLTSNIPGSCCGKVNDSDTCEQAHLHIYNDGCAEKLSEFLIGNSQLIGGIAIGIAALEIIGAVFGLCLASSIRNQYRRHSYA